MGTTRQRLELADAIALAEAVVEHAGKHYVDPNSDAGGGCQYVIDNQCSCIVARIYEAAGLPVETLASWDAEINDVSQSIDDIEAYGLLDEALPTSRGAMAFLVALQKSQDLGLTWGDALREARHYVKDL